MSGLELFADDIDGYLYVAITDNGYLVDLYVNCPFVNGSWASIYLGKVTKVDTKLDAAFMDLGDGLTGYLAAEHALVRRNEEDDVPRDGIGKMVNVGDTFLVQVRTEAKTQTLYEQHKLPRLTANLHVPGGFLVYMPHADKINGAESIDRQLMNNLKTKVDMSGGWKVYPSAAKLSQEEIEFEIEYLKKHWQHILQRAELRVGKPGLIEVGPIALFRALMDYGVTSFEHIYIGNRMIFDIMTAWTERHLPKLAESKRLRLFKPEKQGDSLFEIYDIYSELEKLNSPLVDLPQGGSLLIENTSAMTTIDINQGSSGDINDTNFKATYEIARQIKLRSLNGIILVDFIGSVADKDERKKLLDALESYLNTDIASAQIHGFTRLGMVEITRRRRTASLAEKLAAK